MHPWKVADCDQAARRRRRAYRKDPDGGEKYGRAQCLAPQPDPRILIIIIVNEDPTKKPDRPIVIRRSKPTDLSAADPIGASAAGMDVALPLAYASSGFRVANATAKPWLLMRKGFWEPYTLEMLDALIDSTTVVVQCV